MRAIQQERFGGPEVLELTERADLVPSEGQVRIAVDAAGVHLLDTTLRAGQAGPFGVPTLPTIPGREVAGVIDALGPGVDPSWTGRRVVVHLGAASAGYASQAVAPVEGLIPLADGVDAAEAVAMVGTGRTALGILDEAELVADDVVLVTAAAGGLGALLVQAAKAAGAHVVGVAGGRDKVALAASLGADVAVDYRRPEWVAEVEAALGERRVTAALDGVGGAMGRAAFDLIAPGGRMVLFGYSSNEEMPLSAGDLFSHGVAVTAAIGPRMFARPGGIQGLAEEAVAKLTKGEWHPLLTRFPLADAGAAHQAMVDRATTGKVVLLP